MDNIIKVNFEEWRDVKRVDVNLSEWNYGHVLQVEGLTLPDGDIEVDFSLTEHEGEASAFFGKVKDNILTVNIPDFIFQKEDVYGQSAYDAYAFIYQSDENSGRTIKKIVFTIQARPKRSTNVPEDQKDPFLEEVRQIMAETKEVAQSVRNDADNGEFDGEQGPQGPPGAFEDIPYINPTFIDHENCTNKNLSLKEDEETNITYSSEKVYNKCKESMEKYGAVKFVHLFAGKTSSSQMFFYVTNNTKGQAQSLYKSGDIIYLLTLSILQQNHVDLTSVPLVRNDELIKMLKNYVTFANMASQSTPGLVKTYTAGGTGMDSQKRLVLLVASDTEIKNRTTAKKIISPSNIDIAVQEGLVNSQIEWTTAQKAKALELLGGLQKLSCESDDTLLKGLAYIVDKNNKQSSVEVRVNAIGGTIPVRDATGNMFTQMPTDNYHVANKRYVDDLVGGTVPMVVTEEEIVDSYNNTFSDDGGGDTEPTSTEPYYEMDEDTYEDVQVGTIYYFSENPIIGRNIDEFDFHFSCEDLNCQESLSINFGKNDDGSCVYHIESFDEETYAINVYDTNKNRIIDIGFNFCPVDYVSLEGIKIIIYEKEIFPDGINSGWQLNMNYELSETKTTKEISEVDSMILKSPNGTQYKVTVADDGTLTSTLVKV